MREIIIKDLYKKASHVNETCKRSILRRRIGEGSFVGLKRTYNTPEELVEWLKHVYAYKYAERLAVGQSVLDIGCGTGYGVNELSTRASNTVGADVWKEGVYYCNQEYGEKSSFLRTSGLDLSFRDNSFDLVVSFQVVEHIDPEIVINYLEEIKRVLKNNGTFIISTPNKRLRLLPFQKPWNPDHKKEYDAKELKNMLRRVFKQVEIFGLFATKDAYLAEYKRVRQKPYLVYVINPSILVARRLLPAHFFAMLKRLVIKERINEKSKISKTLINIFSLKDFQTSKRNLKACIDLYGMCMKEMK